MKWFNQLRQDPIGTIADWQDMRWPWILMAAVCVLLVLVAHYMFQVWLYMAPCEQCVYIRFGFLVMAIGGLLCDPEGAGIRLCFCRRDLRSEVLGEACCYPSRHS